MRDEAAEFRTTALRAREAATVLAPLHRTAKDTALQAMADALDSAADSVLAANALDVESAHADGTSEAIVDRLALGSDRVAAMAAGLRDVAALPDPVGEVVRRYTLPNRLEARPGR